jgi:hypothetical protein
LPQFVRKLPANQIFVISSYLEPWLCRSHEECRLRLPANSKENDDPGSRSTQSLPRHAASERSVSATTLEHQHRAPARRTGTEHRHGAQAPSTEHRAPSIEHPVWTTSSTSSTPTAIATSTS